MKHDLKKNPKLTLIDYYGREGKKRIGTVWWILIGLAGLVLVLLITLMIAYGGQQG